MQSRAYPNAIRFGLRVGFEEKACYWLRSPANTGAQKTVALTSNARTGKLLHPEDSVPPGLERARKRPNEPIDDRATTRFIQDGVHAGKRQQGRSDGRAVLVAVGFRRGHAWRNFDGGSRGDDQCRIAR